MNKSVANKLPTGRNVYCVGLKGSGVAAMAVLLKKWGYSVRGSDISDSFFTDKTLIAHNISCDIGFRIEDIQQDVDWVLYSPAYAPEDNLQLQYAFAHYPCFSYPQLLGMVSNATHSTAILGTHGKTSTTAYLALLCQSQKVDSTVLFGSAMPQFDDSGVYAEGKRFFVAEVCEYRNHFAHFTPSIALLLNIDLDHPDTFPTIKDAADAIVGYIDSRKSCLDCIIIHEDARHFFPDEYDVPIITVGEKGDYKVIPKGIVHSLYCFELQAPKQEKNSFSDGVDASDSGDTMTWCIPALNPKLIDNAALAIVLYQQLHNKFYPRIAIDWRKAADALANAKQLQRRSQLLYEGAGITIIDDYAHHPLAIRTTLQGIREIYSPKRLIVSFMSHTYSRTEALLQDFISCFDAADVFYLHPIYPTPREYKKPLGELAQNFFEGVRARVPASQFVPNHMDLVPRLAQELREGDVFVTLGAGNNFELSQALVEALNNNNDWNADDANTKVDANASNDKITPRPTTGSGT